MPEKRYTKDNYTNFNDIYKYVETDLNAEYKEIKKGRGRKITFKQFRKVVNRYLDLVIKDSIDSFNGKDFLFNMGKLQMVGYVHTKKLHKRNSQTPIRTHRTGFIYYTMVWKTNVGKYRIDLDKYYRKKYMYNILQLKKEYMVL
tara:strand:+ start:702 stop:1133 length:432 start_codon:yes stop_codon:yes gene_type:complete